MKTIYSVIDVETTGGKSSNNRITEIAIVKTDGYKIIEKYSTLVNPHRYIDKFVVKLTGITDKMVADAPDFPDLIAEIDAFTKDTIFVAHNVAFDYSVIKKEYKLANKVFKKNKICTVQLSRKTLKEEESYSLGKLTKSLGINLKNRHRALGDAEATALLLHHIIAKVGEEKVLGQSSQENQIIEFKGEITSDIIEELPEDAGTFRFMNKNGNVLYIGFAKNIFSTVTKFLIDEAKFNTHHGLFQDMFAIDYTVFNSFLITQLSALSEIMKHKPTYNKSKMFKTLPIGIYEKENNLQKGPFLIEHNPKDEALWRFSNMNSARRFVRRLHKTNQLIAPIFNGDQAIFDTEYKQKAEVLLKEEIYPNRNFFIIRTVSYEDKAYIVWIENFIYKGFGSVDLEYLSNDIEMLKDCIKHQESNQQIQKMIKKYVMKAKGIRILAY